MKHVIVIFVLVMLVFTAVWFLGTKQAEAPANSSESVSEGEILDSDTRAHIESKSDLITINSPQPNDTVETPLTIAGEARGYWFFEASFPVVLTDWDGKIIAEHYATAEGEWMTEEFVPFTTTIEFESPYNESDPEFMSRGTLILKRDNPSGLPENDDALEIPISFVAQP